MNRFLGLSAVLLVFGTGTLSMDARAGGSPSTMFDMQFAQAGIAVNGQTTVNSTLTTFVGSSLAGNMFTATFAGTAGFDPDFDALTIVGLGGGVMLTPSFGPCGALQVNSFSCTFMNIPFIGPNNAGTVTFSATGTLATLPAVTATFDATIPEPATLALLAIGLLGLGVARRKAIR